MAVWLVRAGSHGECEEKFLREGKVYVTWEGLDVDLDTVREWSELVAEMAKRYPDAKARAVSNWVGQVWPFANEMKRGDLVVVPLKTQPAIYNF